MYDWKWKSFNIRTNYNYTPIILWLQLQRHYFYRKMHLKKNASHTAILNFHFLWGVYLHSLNYTYCIYSNSPVVVPPSSAHSRIAFKQIVDVQPCTWLHYSHTVQQGVPIPPQNNCNFDFLMTRESFYFVWEALRRCIHVC